DDEAARDVSTTRREAHQPRKDLGADHMGESQRTKHPPHDPDANAIGVLEEEGPFEPVGRPRRKDDRLSEAQQADLTHAKTPPNSHSHSRRDSSANRCEIEVRSLALLLAHEDADHASDEEPAGAKQPGPGDLNGGHRGSNERCRHDTETRQLRYP